jgi:hypothetical protein
MRKNLVRLAVGCALASVLLITAIGGAAAGSFTRGCAARDLQILKMIEEHEIGDTVSGEKLSEAMFMMMHARMVCYQGHVIDALALYDDVIQVMSAHPILSERRP